MAAVAQRQLEIMDVKELRRRNVELERKVKEAKAREGDARRELERARERLRVAEDAEERLCADLGELEADTVIQAQEYQLQIKALSDQLSVQHANNLGGSSSSSSTGSFGGGHGHLVSVEQSK